MSPFFSVYLDVIRFLAASAVFLEHLASPPFTRSVIWPPFGKYGAVAVIVFFVLSGYVIAHVTSNRERTFGSFFASRAARLYSVVLIALPLTFVFDRIGMHISPDFYAIQKVLWKPESWAGYISSFFFVNEYQVFGFNGIAPGTNAPYWSLSFEATYYVAAGLAIFWRPRFWIPVNIAILALAGRTIIALLPIWTLGFVLYGLNNNRLLPRRTALIAFWCSIFVIHGAPVAAHFLPADNFGLRLPWGRAPFNRNLIEDSITALAFALHLTAARSLFATGHKIDGRLRSLARWLGSLTFPLYCIHFPAICLLSVISPWRATSAARAIFIAAVTVALVVIVTPMCDLLKARIRDFLLAVGGNRLSGEMSRVCSRAGRAKGRAEVFSEVDG